MLNCEQGELLGVVKCNALMHVIQARHAALPTWPTELSMPTGSAHHCANTAVPACLGKTRWQKHHGGHMQTTETACICSSPYTAKPWHLGPSCCLQLHHLMQSQQGWLPELPALARAGARGCRCHVGGAQRPADHHSRGRRAASTRTWLRGLVLSWLACCPGIKLRSWVGEMMTHRQREMAVRLNNDQ